MMSEKEIAWHEYFDLIDPNEPNKRIVSERIVGFKDGFDAGIKAERDRTKNTLANYQGTYSDYIHRDFYNELFPNEGGEA